MDPAENLKDINYNTRPKTTLSFPTGTLKEKESMILVINGMLPLLTVSGPRLWMASACVILISGLPYNTKAGGIFNH